MMDPIRLLLVDDHDVVRQGLKSLLEGYPNIEVVAEARNGGEAIQRALETKPDVTLMDITMPDMNGFEATRQLRAQCPECEVLALTVHEDKEFLIEMLMSGASGYVTKRSLADDVVTAIEAVAGGKAFLPPKFTRMLIDDFRRIYSGLPVNEFGEAQMGNGDELDVLSKREIEVVKLVAEGHKSAQIGEELGITIRTVSRHRARIMAKLSLNSTAQLVLFAVRTGLVNPAR